MTKASALQRVASLSRKIEQSELSLEQWKWKRAEAMAAASEAGATQREIATAAGLSATQVGKHLKVWSVSGTLTVRPPYSEAFQAATGFDGEAAQARTDQARAKRVLADAPAEQVERIIADLPEDRRRTIVNAALQPETAEAATKRQNRRAVREEHQDDPRWFQMETIKSDLMTVRDRLDHATRTIADENWSESEREQLAKMVGVVDGLVDLLRQAAVGQDGIDWDEELAALTGGDR